ncbi:hypothetical protein M378DRAFT_384616 [Amanita muscaria Koide BX008]|uniref:Uncharacterized protein n=1 Tax=Amanita muscaria (strain Koide BX008) TaxID=946122 RepID=A0A0C2XBV1_AMAMK|nr:hypothetical protein M378DRAFT_384616 [Amanita muscaria Koide BX008]
MVYVKLHRTENAPWSWVRIASHARLRHLQRRLRYERMRMSSSMDGKVHLLEAADGGFLHKQQISWKHSLRLPTRICHNRRQSRSISVGFAKEVKDHGEGGPILDDVMTSSRDRAVLLGLRDLMVWYYGNGRRIGAYEGIWTHG